MRRLRLAVILTLVIAGIVVATFFIIGYLKPKVAGLFIETSPASSVYINGEQVGRTPFKQTVKPGENVIKLIPESFEEPLAPYEARVNLVSGVETVIRRDFGETEDTSSGEIVSFEKVEKDVTSMVIVTDPDSAQLTIDGFQRSVTPQKLSSISAGEHTIGLSLNGYFDRFLRVKTHKGYKLTAVIKLASTGKKTKVLPEEVEEEEEPEPQIEILSTPTGFLRVRAEPSTLGKEVGQVKPGEIYTLLEEDEDSGWYKIEFGEVEEATSSGEEGWISNQYAKKIDEEEVTPKVTPSVKTGEDE